MQLSNTLLPISVTVSGIFTVRAIHKREVLQFKQFRVDYDRFETCAGIEYRRACFFYTLFQGYFNNRIVVFEYVAV